MKKYLLIIHPHFTIPGGAGKVILELGKRLSKEMSVVMIAQKINPEYIAEFPELTFESINGPITSSFFFWLLFPLWYFKTAKIINTFKKQGEISILCNVFPANWLGLLYKFFHKEISCSWFCHEPSGFIHIKKWRNAITSPLKKNIANAIAPIMAIIDKKLTTYANEIFVNSAYSQAVAEKIYHKKGIIIHPGVDTEKYKPSLFKEKENYLLSVGRLSKFKNLDILISAFAKLENKKMLLYIIGNGEEKNNLQNLAKKLRVNERIKFLSNISDEKIINYYAKAKLFVLCSKNEPFGIVSIEAMACGTAVIADDSGGPLETVKNKETGELINCDVKNLCHTLEKLLSNEELLKRYSVNAMKHIELNFNWDDSTKKIKEFL
jgi:glycosyltransferase involved in cell wall biosynthesis